MKNYDIKHSHANVMRCRPRPVSLCVSSVVTQSIDNHD